MMTSKSVEKRRAVQKGKTALSVYNASIAECGDESEPIERLRQFLSYALTGKDWLDVEPFLEALYLAPRQIRSEVKNKLEEIMYAMRTKAANNIVIKDTTLEKFADEIEQILADMPRGLNDES